jgi:WD40 repeat protein
VRVWDASKAQQLLKIDVVVVFPGGLFRPAPAAGVAFSSGLTRLATFSLAFRGDGGVPWNPFGQIKVWNARTGTELLNTLSWPSPRKTRYWAPSRDSGLGSGVVAFSPDGARLAVACGPPRNALLEKRSDKGLFVGREGSMDAGPMSLVKLWDAQSGQELLTLKDAGGSVAFSPDGARLASGDYDGIVRFLDSRTGKKLRDFKGHVGPVNSVAFSPDATRLASGSNDGSVKVWDARSREEWVAEGIDNGSLKLWEPRTGRLRFIFLGRPSQPLGPLDESGKWVVKIMDPRHGGGILTLQGHTDVLTSVASSPDGAYLASGSRDTTVRVRDVRTGQELLTLRGHTAAVTCLAFSPDGAYLASGSPDTTVRVWDARTGQEVLTLRGHTDQVESLAFSPDGQRLASGAWDQTVRLWDTRTGQQLVVLRGFTGAVLKLWFSPDGALLVCEDQKEFRVWDGGPGNDSSVPKQQVAPRRDPEQVQPWWHSATTKVPPGDKERPPPPLPKDHLKGWK